MYTYTHGPKCVDHSREHEGVWSCPGPSGYTGEFSDEGNLAAFSIRSPDRKKGAAAYVFPGRGRVFGDAIDWRIVDDRPAAAVLRIWRAASRADGSEGDVQELAVFKVTPRTSCRVASVDARQTAANETARRLASEAAPMPCLTGD
ncbi:hypothetical protein QCM77_07695 [Bradyrhizobium sp. SSUT18]|uniref:hypothetical protein n=1 Tax=Bradyrhizobium sp. SSUT18 TaxID=3040602 RepID=UPI002448743D|nr:hypothetical protein [Bradyrhizobium sp. SSUT18]MDH2399828.1 hypothetical protein [Bradyrhizobium sp. SSUT18]